MSTRPRAIVIRAAGTNCDEEMRRAFEAAGAAPDLVHVGRLIDDPSRLRAYDLIGLPGGFSYGDDVASGRVFAVHLRERLYPALREAALRGVPMIGACNGFQILVQVGLLPGPTKAGEWPATPPAQTCALTDNASARFTDRWVRFEVPANTRCVWTKGLAGPTRGGYTPEAMALPIAHGEGRFVADSPTALGALSANGQIAALYAPGDNPNGSEGDIAGICDASGTIFGLMPHPERYLEWANHPFWTRLDERARTGDTPGLAMFKSAVGHVVARGASDGSAAPRGLGGATGVAAASSGKGVAVLHMP